MLSKIENLVFSLFYLCKSNYCQKLAFWYNNCFCSDLNQRRSPFETWSPVCTTVCHALCFGTSEISLLLPQAAVDFFAVEQPNSSAETKGRWLSSMQERDTKKAYTNVYALFVAPCVGLEPTTLRLTAECSTD